MNKSHDGRAASEVWRGQSRSRVLLVASTIRPWHVTRYFLLLRHEYECSLLSVSCQVFCSEVQTESWPDLYTTNLKLVPARTAFSWRCYLLDITSGCPINNKPFVYPQPSVRPCAPPRWASCDQTHSWLLPVNVQSHPCHSSTKLCPLPPCPPPLSLDGKRWIIIILYQGD